MITNCNRWLTSALQGSWSTYRQFLTGYTISSASRATNGTILLQYYLHSSNKTTKEGKQCLKKIRLP